MTLACCLPRLYRMCIVEWRVGDAYQRGLTPLSSLLRSNLVSGGHFAYCCLTRLGPLQRARLIRADGCPCSITSSNYMFYTNSLCGCRQGQDSGEFHTLLVLRSFLQPALSICRSYPSPYNTSRQRDSITPNRYIDIYV